MNKLHQTHQAIRRGSFFHLHRNIKTTAQMKKLPGVDQLPRPVSTWLFLTHVWWFPKRSFLGAHHRQDLLDGRLLLQMTTCLVMHYRPPFKPSSEASETGIQGTGLCPPLYSSSRL